MMKKREIPLLNSVTIPDTSTVVEARGQTPIGVITEVHGPVAVTTRGKLAPLILRTLIVNQTLKK